MYFNFSESLKPLSNHKVRVEDIMVYLFMKQVELVRACDLTRSV